MIPISGESWVDEKWKEEKKEKELPPTALSKRLLQRWYRYGFRSVTTRNIMFT